MSQSKRKQTAARISDQGLLDNLGYNASAGGFKNVPVGPKLNPLNSNGSTYTTNATTAIALAQSGLMLAVYNNSGSVGSITISEVAVASLTAGVTDAQGHVGIACKPNDWTYIAMGDYTFVIASASTLLVYQIEDDSFLAQ